jgi:hypothetical protein
MKRPVPSATLMRVTRANVGTFVEEFLYGQATPGRRLRGWYYLAEGAVIGPYLTARGAFRAATAGREDRTVRSARIAADVAADAADDGAEVKAD